MFSINYQSQSQSFKPNATTLTYHYTIGNYLNTIYDDDESATGSDSLPEEAQCNQGYPKQRIITYFRNEILVIPVSEIALIYMDCSITYVVTMDGKKSTSQCGLGSLFTQLDDHNFFRVNRQIIIGVTAIKKIVKHKQGLKVLTQPSLETKIIVGKNKVLRFKNWLSS